MKLKLDDAPHNAGHCSEFCTAVPTLAKDMTNFKLQLPTESMPDAATNEAENVEQPITVITRGLLNYKTKASAEGGLAGMCWYAQYGRELMGCKSPVRNWES